MKEGLSMLRLENKVAIVTGGASGIGRAIVERFREEGGPFACSTSRAARIAMK